MILGVEKVNRKGRYFLKSREMRKIRRHLRGERIWDERILKRG